MVDAAKLQIAAGMKEICRMASSTAKEFNLILNRNMKEAGKMMLKKAKAS